MGLDKPPEGAYYYAPEKPVGNAQTTEEVAAIIEEHGVELIVLDSLTIGAAGTDASDQRSVTELLRAVEDWGVTVIALDHVAKSSKMNPKGSSIFGSVFKRNKARSSLRLYQDGDLLQIKQEKSNFGPLHDAMSYEVVFEEDGDRTTVRINPKEVYLFDCETDQMLEEPDPTNADLILWAVDKLWKETGEAVDAARVAEESGIDLKQVRNGLASLARSGVLDRPSRGYYRPRATLGAVPREDGEDTSE